MTLNVQNLLQSMLSQAQSTAASSWSQIASVATHEFKIAARRIIQIGQEVAAGRLTKSDAQSLMRLARNHMVAIIAALTTMVLKAVEKIVNAALAAIRTAVNTELSFVLL